MPAYCIICSTQLAKQTVYTDLMSQNRGQSQHGKGAGNKIRHINNNKIQIK